MAAVDAKVKILARRGPAVALVDAGLDPRFTGPGARLARVWDGERLHPPFPLQSILARGGWDPPVPEDVPALQALVAEALEKERP